MFYRVFVNVLFIDAFLLGLRLIMLDNFLTKNQEIARRRRGLIGLGGV